MFCCFVNNCQPVCVTPGLHLKCGSFSSVISEDDCLFAFWGGCLYICKMSFFICVHSMCNCVNHVIKKTFVCSILDLASQKDTECQVYSDMI